MTYRTQVGYVAPSMMVERGGKLELRKAEFRPHIDGDVMVVVCECGNIIYGEARENEAVLRYKRSVIVAKDGGHIHSESHGRVVDKKRRAA